MSESNSERSPRERQLDALIAEYYGSIEQGQPVNQEEFLQRHPEFASELRDFFADVGQIERVVPTARLELEETQPPERASPTRRNPGTKVPYLGDYEILEELGAGGMGVVYKARQTKLKKIVALKMIKVGQLASDEEVRRFQAEARAAAKLDHPGIVAVHEVGVDRQHYYAMDFVAGGSLSMLHREAPVAARQAAELVKKLAEAMHYAHGQGIVHRDLKPANVLLTTNGNPRITDFGLAKRLWADDDTAGVTMTETGQVLGTAGYMSPEQAAGKTRLVGPPSDIYSLGAILYALLTSRAPFVGESQADTILQVIQKEPISPRTLNPSVPRDLETICLKCLEKEPHKRYGTAGELADDLARFWENKPVLARPVSTLERTWRWCRRNPWAATAVALLVLLAVGSPPVALGMYQLAADKDKALIDKDNALVEKGKALVAKDKALVEKQGALKDAEGSLKTARWNTYVARFYNLTTAWRNREWGVLDRMLGELAPKEQEPDFRGWEWHYLRDQYRQKVQVLDAQRNYIRVRWSPDGKLLAARRDDLTIDIWTVSGKLHGQIATRVGRDLAWSPDSKQLAASEGLFGVSIWDVEYLRMARRLAPHSTERKSTDGNGLDWSLDGQLVVQSGCGWIDTWKPDGTPLKSLAFGRVDGGNNYTLTVHLHPSERVLAMARRSGAVSLINLDTGKMEWTKSVCTVDCLSVRWNAKGDKLAVGTSYPTFNALLLNRQGVQLHSLEEHKAQINSLAWQTEEAKLVCVGKDHQISIWNPATGKMLQLEHLHNGIVHDVDVRPGVSDVATVGQDGGIRIWRTDTEFLQAREVPTGFALRDIAWCSSRNWMAAPDRNNVAIISNNTGLRVKTLLGRQWRIDLVAWHPDGRILAALDMHGEIRIWDVESGELLNVLEAGSGGIGYYQLAWSPNGRFLASSGNEWPHPGHTAGIYVFDLEQPKGKKSPIFVDEQYRGSVAWSPDSKNVIVGDFHLGSLTLWDVAEHRQLWAKKVVKIVHLAFHPQGKQIAACHNNGSFSIFRAADGVTLTTIVRHTGEVVEFRWSPDGKRFVTSSKDGTIRIWDSTTFDELLTLSAKAAGGICWSPDGSQIATGGKQPGLRFWGPETTTLEDSFVELDRTTNQNDMEYAKGLIKTFKEVQIDDTWINSTDAIPSGPFAITGMRFDHQNPIDDAQLKFLLKRTRLSQLEIADLELSPDAFISLLANSQLRHLSLRRTQVNDQQALELAKLPGLKFLDLEDSLVMQESLETLRTMRPDMEVRWKDRLNVREVASRLIAKNAKLSVMTGTQRQNIDPGQALPSLPFRIVSIKAEEKIGLTVADFEGLEKLDTLESIDLLHTRLDDEVLAKLTHATNLRFLGCGSTTITGKPLAQFEAMPKMTMVVFGGSLGDENTSHFDKFPNLTAAHLGWSLNLTDKGLENLPILKGLTSLHCDHTKIDGSGLATLSRFAKLQRLNLSHTLLTDDGLRNLPVLSELTELNLSATAITDVSVPHLSQFKTLIKLNLVGTALTPAGIAELRKALPRCAIEGTK